MRRPGGERAAFVAQVSKAPISQASKAWLLKFAGRDARAGQALTALQRAHAMDRSGGMERWFRRYTQKFSERGVNGKKTTDPKLAKRGAKLRKKLAGKTPPALVVMIDGPDGAGKSSAIRELTKQLQGPYRVLPKTPRLGVPDPKLPWASWVKKQLGVSRAGWLAPGQLLFVDRSVLGQVVYGKDPKGAKRDIAALERQLQAQHNVKILHIVARPSRERVRQTYGKRLAYELFASQLAQPKPTVSERDVPAYENFKGVRKRFDKAAAHFSANTLVIDVSDRKAARIEMLDWIGKQIR